MYAKIDSFLGAHDSLSVDQISNSMEVLTGFATCNKYRILDKDGQECGFIAEKSGGILGALMRLVLRNHRPMSIMVWNKNEEEVLRIRRPFYFLWSNIRVFHHRHRVGNVRRRFSIMKNYYGIHRRTGKIIARIKNEHMSRRFSIVDSSGSEIGIVKKEMGPLKKELFTDSDRFFVGFPSDWNSEDKSLLLAAAVTIDMDFFESNSSD